MRIIPAYAGSTAFAQLREAVAEDHPRIRGEHRRMSSKRSSRRGSSPHTRGARISHHCHLRPVRIIPAYAGSTRDRAIRRHPPTDHPRIRGEHGMSFRRRTWTSGSSPHTRGAPALDVGGAQLDGIIPAYAGSTLRNAYKLTKLEDHPRIRGEHRPGAHLDERLCGSSPHTRGARLPNFPASPKIWIIPAYAGSTRLARR